jgi:hypothetical protein
MLYATATACVFKFCGRNRRSSRRGRASTRHAGQGRRSRPVRNICQPRVGWRRTPKFARRSQPSRLAGTGARSAVTRAAATRWLATLCDRFGRREPPHPAPVWYEAVMWVAMSAAEREEFLVGVHVGVLSAAIGTAGRTLAVPGLVQLPAGRAADGADWPPVAQGRGDPRRWPVRPVRAGSPPQPLCQRRGAGRKRGGTRSRRAAGDGPPYLGAAGGNRYVADNPDPGRENVAFRMRPEHWLSQDQGKGQAKG